jgi:glycosyltransferase involved in cell wall biosynthesis
MTWTGEDVEVSIAFDETRERRPTILHFIYGVGGGGAEAMMRSLLRGLDRRRWRVVLVAMQAKAWPEESEELQRTVDAFHVLEETSLLSRSALGKLWDLMRIENPDVVQTWMHHADFTGGLVARMAGVKRVVWGIHCREITRAPRESKIKAWLFSQMMPLMSYWLPSRVVSCSQVALEDHLRIGYAKEKLTWIPNGVDIQRFNPTELRRKKMREQLGLKEDVFLIGFVGRFHEMKHLPLLLRAFGLLSARQPEACLILCGVKREDLDEECEMVVQRLPNTARILWLPFQSDPERFYPGLDVFTLSSRTEACPMTILEAMACGVTCVTTNVGDCGRLIGETGTVVAAGDEEALASAWGELFGMSRQERQEMGVACRARVIEMFSLERAAARYSDLYEDLIQRGATK